MTAAVRMTREALTAAVATRIGDLLGDLRDQHRVHEVAVALTTLDVVWQLLASVDPAATRDVLHLTADLIGDGGDLDPEGLPAREAATHRLLDAYTHRFRLAEGEA